MISNRDSLASNRRTEFSSQVFIGANVSKMHPDGCDYSDTLSVAFASKMPCDHRGRKPAKAMSSMLVRSNLSQPKISGHVLGYGTLKTKLPESHAQNIFIHHQFIHPKTSETLIW